MTNGEKYLKDEVVAKELWKTFQVYYYKNKSKESDVEKAFRHFFEEETEPVLTEDERVILRNIDTKMWNTILRENGEITFAYKLSRGYRSLGRCEWFSHLFQFIKERRRIFNNRIVRR